MIVVAIGFSIVTGDGRHRVVIVADAVPVVGHVICVSGVWVVACPSQAYGCMPFPSFPTSRVVFRLCNSEYMHR